MLRRSFQLLAFALIALPAAAQSPPQDSWIKDAGTGCRIRNPAPQPQESVTWSGACPNGIAEGTGILQWFDDAKPGDRYEGELRDGWENGRGTATSTMTADRYDGEWRDGWRHGQGVYDFANGDRYEGQWRDGRANGAGTLTSSDRRVLTGTWTDGCLRHGDHHAVVGATARECGFE